MNQAQIIQLTGKEAVIVNEMGEVKAVELKETKTAMWRNAPFKKYNDEELIHFISEAGEVLEELKALLAGIESLAVDRFLNGWFDENDEAKDEVRTLLRLLDVANRQVAKVDTYVSAVGNSFIKDK
jgi:hypothetical protein